MISLKTYFGIVWCLTISVASATAQHPAIIGISHMCIYSSDLAAADNFYGRILGATKGDDPQNPKGTRYYFSPTQFVEILPLPTGHTLSRMACVAYNTADANGLRRYLIAHGQKVNSELIYGNDGGSWFNIKDPEGNEIQFVQLGSNPPITMHVIPISTHIIHMGFLVHDKAAEDHFYRELLPSVLVWCHAARPCGLDLTAGSIWSRLVRVHDGGRRLNYSTRSHRPKRTWCSESLFSWGGQYGAGGDHPD